MIEKIIKAVKSSNKKRSRNITIGAVVGFLLLCTAVMGANDHYLWIKKDGEIKFNTTAAIDADGSWSTTNPYANAGNIWDTITNTYTNNMTLSSSKANGEYEDEYGYNCAMSYGLRLSGDLAEVKFINNGSIIGRMSDESSSSYGYGIYNSAAMGNIENTGVISGYGSSSGRSGYGYGIYNLGTMGNITNTGIISASGSGTGVGSSGGIGEGSGIYNYYNGIIGNITNIGMISGYGTGTGVGFGIYNSAAMGNIINTGIISGTGVGSSGGTGDGFGIYNFAAMGNITNIGVISGTGSSAYGIYDSGSIGSKGVAITNTGVIYGKDNAINGGGTTVNNYGILVNGRDQNVNSGVNPNNYGLIIKNGSEIVDKDSVQAKVNEDIKEYNDNGTVKSIRKMTIKNETGSNSFTGNENDSILNALKDTYNVIDTNNKVTGSIINAYGTAVIFGDTGDKELTLSGTIVNGGIDNSAAISGSDNSNNGDTLILQSGEIKYTDNNGVEKSATQNTVVNGNIDMKDGSDNLIARTGTVINGDVDMGEGADILTIGAGTIINGTLDGGTGSDILNFGISSGARSNSPESEGVRILHNITGFENMNINTNVTLYEKTIGADGKETALKVSGVEKIKIEKDGNLILRVDGTNKNSHALSTGNTTGTIESNGGKLLLALNGVSEGSTINIGMKLGDSMYGIENKEIIYIDKFTLDTTSVLHSVERKNGSSEVIVTSKPDLPVSPDTPENVNYEKLNKIYQSMRVVDGVKEFNVDNSDEKLSAFLGYLNDIYAGNPYSYSSELSRKSVGMFRDIATENQFKPELNKWLIMGGLTHVDGGTKDTYYGKGYYTYDVGSSDMDADTKITGAYMLGEYGASDTLTYGVVIGGNKLKSNLSNGSKVDGDALYMGAYAKKYVGNLKVTGGLGLQYGDYDADRLAVNKVASSLAEPVMKYSDNYNDMTYDIYLNGRYSNPMGDNFFLEPYGTLSYTYIKQDSADEGSKVLAIETDSKSFDYTAAKVGVDIKKVIPHEKGKSTLSAGVSYTRLLTGADEENITGRFKGGSDFDILVAHKNEHSIGLNAKYTLELENGILFDVKGSYNVERDSHNGNGKNRNKGEWIAGTGLGYKF